MTAARAVLAELRSRGAQVRRVGDRVRIAPASVLTPDLLDRARAVRDELLALVSERPAVAQQEHRITLDAVACTGSEAAAWRIYSHRVGRSLWIYRDVAALQILERDGLGGLPALHACDLERIRDWPDQRIAGLLNVLAVFPGARLADIPAEPGDEVVLQ